jgi:general stress protein YciG
MCCESAARNQLLKKEGSMADNTSKRGFASMDKDQQRDIASKGGQSQGKENNPANFANDRKKASEAGQEGGKASHRND